VSVTLPTGDARGQKPGWREMSPRRKMSPRRRSWEIIRWSIRPGGGMNNHRMNNWGGAGNPMHAAVCWKPHGGGRTSGNPMTPAWTRSDRSTPPDTGAEPCRPHYTSFGRMHPRFTRLHRPAPNPLPPRIRPAARARVPTRKAPAPRWTWRVRPETGAVGFACKPAPGYSRRRSTALATSPRSCCN
jgi:hypothetical protein